MTNAELGINLAGQPDGRRSTSKSGRSIVAAALRPVDPVGARAAEAETAWRSGYLLHFRRLVEAGLATPQDWRAIAAAGLAAAHEQSALVSSAGEQRFSSVISPEAESQLETVEVAARGDAEIDFSLPYRGRRLRGADLEGQLADWVRRGVLEPSAAEVVTTVAAHPEWLSLPGHAVAVLGAGAEMGPLRALLRWGATVAAVDLPNPAVWERAIVSAEEGTGRLLVPTRAGASGVSLSERAGVDLLTEVPAVADWRGALDGRPVLGNYLYADGGTHARVSLAADALALRIGGVRPDLALAFLATPTDAFVAPREAVEQSTRAYVERFGTAKVIGRPLRWASRGRLMHRAYPPDADPWTATRWSRSRGRTTRWPSGSNAGGRPPRPPTVSSSPSTSRRRPGPVRWSRTARWGCRRSWGTPPAGAEVGSPLRSRWSTFAL